MCSGFIVISINVPKEYSYYLQMYKTDIVCTYSDLETYQAMLLRILDTDVDGMTAKIQAVYDHIHTEEPVQALLKKVHGWSPEFSFFVLFSYEYFEHMHRFLCELLTQQPLTTHDALLNLLG